MPDIATLRSEHHICGVLAGTLPHLSQQNLFLGIPLILMPEEVIYLVETGLCHNTSASLFLIAITEIAAIVDDSKAYPTPSSADMNVWVSEQQEAIKCQLTIGAEERKRSLHGHSVSEEASIKRREREERREMTTDASTPPFTQSSVSPSDSSANYTLVIPASSTSFDWYLPTNARCIYTSIAAAKVAGVWNFPSNSHENARCNIFRDLRGKGYFIGGGIKFGGDYLIYPGDPLRYHSHFVASVHESPVSTLRPLEIIAHGRLGTATKKTHLLCGWDGERKEASYLSIEWAGFG
ncbi:hypothetical protein AX17_001961 [Amanita inopinata Kibby_2008]|nr:hypothetical protein AX17_001961 [Amanita inopinata Kibby_2008]